MPILSINRPRGRVTGNAARWRTAAAAALIAAVPAVLAGCGTAEKLGQAAHDGGPSAGPRATPSASVNPLGPDACNVPSPAGAGSGSWRIVMPSTVCGMQADTNVGDKQSGEGLVQVEQSSFDGDLYPGIGTARPGTYGSWNTPSGLGVYRSIIATGFDGSFNPKIAMPALEDGGGTYRPVPAGPHGGVMACATSDGALSCAWATTTTAGMFELSDTSGQLISGSRADKVAVDVRDVLEARG